MHPTQFPGDLFAHLRSLTALEASFGRAGTFAHAARSLRVDESVLRRRVLALGDLMGEPLVEGRGARMRWTPSGRRLRDAAERAFAELEGAFGAKPTPPRLQIGCTGTIANELLPVAVAALERSYPDLVVQIARTGAEEAMKRVDDGTLDLAVVRASAKTPPPFPHRLVSRDRLHLAVPTGHPLARGPLSVAAMARCPIVTFRPSSSTRARVMRVLEPLGAKPRIEVEGKSAALRYVELGLGVAFVSVLPQHEVRAPGVVLRDVSRWFEATSFWAIWRKGRAQPAWERRAVELLATRGPVRISSTR